MATTLRPGRKKITTSFVMTPDLHQQFREQYPNRGDQSFVIEQLVRKLLKGEVFISPRTPENSTA
jgi:hypothetical protein